MKPGGVLVSPREPARRRTSASPQRARRVHVGERNEALTAIAALFEARKLAARVGTVLPLCRARLAHEWLSAPTRKAGKLVLQVV
jgi:NADPH:quinone reductase-like Zn-dependent oxidoreductase